MSDFMGQNPQGGAPGPQGQPQAAFPASQEPQYAPPASYASAGPVGQQQVVAKNPGLAAFLSAIFTGGGQIYNGQIGLGLFLICLQVVNVILAFVLIGILTGFATWAFSVYHAYSEAQKFNTAHGIVS